MAEDEEGAVRINVLGMYGAKTKQALVGIQINDRRPIYLTPDESRQLALQLMGTAFSSETDALMMDWLKDRLGMDSEERRAIAITDLRDMRTQKLLQQGGPG